MEGGHMTHLVDLAEPAAAPTPIPKILVHSISKIENGGERRTCAPSCYAQSAFEAVASASMLHSPNPDRVAAFLWSRFPHSPVRVQPAVILVAEEGGLEPQGVTLNPISNRFSYPALVLFHSLSKSSSPMTSSK